MRQPAKIAMVGPRRRPEPERIYDQLVGHCLRCPSCRPWMDQLYKVRRLCPVGKTIVELYARTVAMASDPGGSVSIAVRPVAEEVSCR